MSDTLNYEIPVETPPAIITSDLTALASIEFFQDIWVQLINFLVLIQILLAI